MTNSDAELRCLCCDRPVDPIRAATCSKSCASQVRREAAASERARLELGEDSGQAAGAPPRLSIVGEELRCFCCGRQVDPFRSATCSKSCASRVRREAAANERAKRKADTMMLRQLEAGTWGGRGGA